MKNCRSKPLVSSSTGLDHVMLTDVEFITDTLTLCGGPVGAVKDILITCA